MSGVKIVIYKTHKHTVRVYRNEKKTVALK